MTIDRPGGGRGIESATLDRLGRRILDESQALGGSQDFSPARRGFLDAVEFRPRGVRFEEQVVEDEAQVGLAGPVVDPRCRGARQGLGSSGSMNW